MATGAPLYESTANGDYYYVTDYEGSVIGLVAPSGTSRATYSYTPYGAQSSNAVNGPLPPNNLGYDGGYMDPSTGLVHFGDRYYDPTVGRWTQLDPSGQSAGYVFASDDPVNYTDTNGDDIRIYSLDPLSAGILGAALVFGNNHILSQFHLGPLSSYIKSKAKELGEQLLACSEKAFRTLNGFDEALKECVIYLKTYHITSFIAIPNGDIEVELKNADNI